MKPHRRSSAHRACVATGPAPRPPPAHAARTGPVPAPSESESSTRDRKRHNHKRASTQPPRLLLNLCHGGFNRLWRARRSVPHCVRLGSTPPGHDHDAARHCIGGTRRPRTCGEGVKIQSAQGVTFRLTPAAAMRQDRDTSRPTIYSRGLGAAGPVANASLAQPSAPVKARQPQRSPFHQHVPPPRVRPRPAGL